MVNYNINLEGKTVLVTGAAGFIGSNLVKRLFHDVKNIKVIGIDSITDYYDVNIKYARLKEIEALDRDWTFVHASIADKEAVDKIFTENNISVVVNLAAQAGVRYSITNPDAYIQSNLIGFYNILEACRHHEVEHLVYASSSSVYGSNKKVPYSTDDKVDNPVSLYEPLRRVTSLWLMPIANSITFLLQAFASSLSMVQLVVQIWHTLVSQISLLKVRQSRSLTMAIVSATSLTSMTL